MIGMMWSIFEIAINYYQGFVETVFITKFLSAKSHRLSYFYQILYTAIIGTSITLLNKFVLFEGVASLIYWILLFSYACLAFKDKMIKKILASIIPLLILFFITSTSLNLLASIFGISVEEMVTTRDVRRLCVLLIVQVAYIVVICVVAKLLSFDTEDYSVIDWIPIISVLVVSVLLIAFMHIFSLDIMVSHRIYINLSCVLILVINLLALYNTNSLYQKNKKLKELEIYKLNERYQQQYIDSTNIQYDLIRKIRHDLKNQLSTVYTLIESGHSDEAMRVISENQHIVSSNETVVRTNNVIVNAIINSKLTTASTYGINVSCMSVSDFDGINEIDLCNLLSNALENALTACMKCENLKEKYISVKIIKENQIFTFLIKNSIDDSVLEKNPNLITTKKDKNNHGLGTKIISDISQKYGGRCDFYESDNTFCCQIILQTSSSE